MSRKSEIILDEKEMAAAIASPLRRSTRIANSPAPVLPVQGVPARIAGSRRSSASSVASEPPLETVPVKTRGRRASLSQESSLNRVSPAPETPTKMRSRRSSVSSTQEEKDEIQTPTKTRSRLSSISSVQEENEVQTPTKTRGRKSAVSTLQDESSNTDGSARAGSPAVSAGSVISRRRSLRRSSTSSPTEEKSTESAVQPAKLRGRRPSAEKSAPPKRRGSAALEPIEEAVSSTDQVPVGKSTCRAASKSPIAELKKSKLSTVAEDNETIVVEKNGQDVLVEKVGSTVSTTTTSSAKKSPDSKVQQNTITEEKDITSQKQETLSPRADSLEKHNNDITPSNEVEDTHEPDHFDKVEIKEEAEEQDEDNTIITSKPFKTEVSETRSDILSSQSPSHDPTEDLTPDEENRLLQTPDSGVDSNKKLNFTKPFVQEDKVILEKSGDVKETPKESLPENDLCVEELPGILTNTDKYLSIPEEVKLNMSLDTSKTLELEISTEEKHKSRISPRLSPVVLLGKDFKDVPKKRRSHHDENKSEVPKKLRNPRKIISVVAATATSDSPTIDSCLVVNPVEIKDGSDGSFHMSLNISTTSSTADISYMSEKDDHNNSNESDKENSKMSTPSRTRKNDFSDCAVVPDITSTPLRVTENPSINTPESLDDVFSDSKVHALKVTDTSLVHRNNLIECKTSEDVSQNEPPNYLTSSLKNDELPIETNVIESSTVCDKSISVVNPSPNVESDITDTQNSEDLSTKLHDTKQVETEIVIKPPMNEENKILNSPINCSTAEVNESITNDSPIQILVKDIDKKDITAERDNTIEAEEICSSNEKCDGAPQKSSDHHSNEIEKESNIPISLVSVDNEVSVNSGEIEEDPSTLKSVVSIANDVQLITGQIDKESNSLISNSSLLIDSSLNSSQIGMESNLKWDASVRNESSVSSSNIEKLSHQKSADNDHVKMPRNEKELREQNCTFSTADNGVDFVPNPEGNPNDEVGAVNEEMENVRKCVEIEEKVIDVCSSLNVDVTTTPSKRGQSNPKLVTTPKQKISAEIEKKLDDLIALKSAIEINDSDSEPVERSEFINISADEGEEDTPSEDSNEIIEIGESIGSKDSESNRDSSDDEYEKDSFVDDNDYEELLSGDEYDLQESSAPKKRKNRKVIRPIDDSDDEITAVTADSVKEKDTFSNSMTTTKLDEESLHSESSSFTQDEEYERDGFIVDDDHASAALYKNKGKDTRESRNEEEEVDKPVNILEVITIKSPDNVAEASTSTDPVKVQQARRKRYSSSAIPNPVKRSNMDLIRPTFKSPLSNENTVNAAPNDTDELNSSQRRNKKRKSSINIQENLNLKTLDNSGLSDKISNIVDVFCLGLNQNSGNLTLNVSLEFDQSSNDSMSEAPGNSKNESDSISKLKSDRKMDDRSLNTSQISAQIESTKSVEQSNGAKRRKMNSTDLGECNVEAVSSKKSLKESQKKKSKQDAKKKSNVLDPCPRDVLSEVLDAEGLTASKRELRLSPKGASQKPISLSLKKRLLKPSTSTWQSDFISEQVTMKPSKSNKVVNVNTLQTEGFRNDRISTTKQQVTTKSKSFHSSVKTSKRF